MNDILRLLGYLGLSVSIHAVFFISFPHQATMHAFIKKPLEVTYQEISAPEKNNRLHTAKPIILSDSAYVRLTSQEKEPTTFPKNKLAQDLIKNEIFREKTDPNAPENPFEKESAESLKKTVSLPSIPGETFKSPEYKSYNQIIRERIRRLAYYHYKKLERGEIFLTFTLASNGELLDATIVDQKSSPNSYLRDITLTCIQEAKPYPEFPEKLKNNKKLTFNVIISFELK